MPGKFKEARQVNKLKVIKVTAKLGISQPTLSAWEGGGNKSPSAEGFKKMANLHSVTANYLLTAENNNPLIRLLPFR